MQTRTFSVLNSYFLVLPNSTQALKSDSPLRSISLNLKAVRCNNAGAADRWLHAFAGVKVPANGEVPLFTPLLLQANFTDVETFYSGRIIPKPGLVLAVSSTRAALTVDVAATVDISADVEEFEYNPPDTIYVVGDYTTNVKQLQVWTDANGPRVLLLAEVINTGAGTIYVMLFPTDNPADGSIPLEQWALAVDNSLTMSFGKAAGRSPYRKDADGTVHDGCTVCLSSTPGALTLVAANSGSIRATYKLA